MPSKSTSAPKKLFSTSKKSRIGQIGRFINKEKDAKMIEPLYQDETCTLYYGDCLDIMPQLPTASIDAVVADLPYGTMKKRIVANGTL